MQRQLIRHVDDINRDTLMINTPLSYRDIRHMYSHLNQSLPRSTISIKPSQ